MKQFNTNGQALFHTSSQFNQEKALFEQALDSSTEKYAEQLFDAAQNGTCNLFVSLLGRCLDICQDLKGRRIITHALLRNGAGDTILEPLLLSDLGNQVEKKQILNYLLSVLQPEEQKTLSLIKNYKDESIMSAFMHSSTYYNGELVSWIRNRFTLVQLLKINEVDTAEKINNFLMNEQIGLGAESIFSNIFNMNQYDTIVKKLASSNLKSLTNKRQTALELLNSYTNGNINNRIRYSATDQESIKDILYLGSNENPSRDDVIFNIRFALNSPRIQFIRNDDSLHDLFTQANERYDISIKSIHFLFKIQDPRIAKFANDYSLASQLRHLVDYDIVKNGYDSNRNSVYGVLDKFIRTVSGYDLRSCFHLTEEGEVAFDIRSNENLQKTLQNVIDEKVQNIALIERVVNISLPSNNSQRITERVQNGGRGKARSISNRDSNRLIIADRVDVSEGFSGCMMYDHASQRPITSAAPITANNSGSDSIMSDHASEVESIEVRLENDNSGSEPDRANNRQRITERVNNGRSTARTTGAGRTRNRKRQMNM